MEYTILIVEDDLTFSTMLASWLKKKGFTVDTAGSSIQARKLLQRNSYDLVLSDYRLPDEDGVALLSWMKEKNMQAPFIMMTNYADIRTAVETMKTGATDFLSKPIQPDELLKKIREALQQSSPDTPSSGDLTSEQVYSSTYIEGRSEAALLLYNYVDLVAPTPMSVLISGASGTGKEYIAHRIHQHSKRADKVFLALDCGSIPKELASSEFFGHIKGSFTGAVSDKTGAFEQANGGTLFLDEIGNLSYEVQVQLLRALQEKRIRKIGSAEEIEVDIRLVSATNEDLSAAIENGTFREDLYHRINEFTLKMPTLSECREDIMIYANFFLDQANRDLDRRLCGFDATAIDSLQSYSWPGNLRQLKNTIRRATLLAKSELIRRTDLDPDILQIYTPTSEGITALKDERTEKERILKALRQAHNNKSKAAQMLGIDRKTLYNKLKLYDINL